MQWIAKVLFFALVVKPTVLFVLGLNIRGRRNLPLEGPAVIAANHNSHLDTMVLMSLYPLSCLHRVRPVAAADYFLRNRYLAWFALRCVGIIPVDRSGGAPREQLFEDCKQALKNGDVLVLFPEGSRGEPEKIGPIKKGLFHLLAGQSDTPVIPVVTHGLGKALPRGTALLVPFNCDVVIGNRLPAAGSADELVSGLSATFDELLELCLTRSEDDSDLA